ncbi:MAG: ATP-dependent metallopeptidase FtsH/Yme1/Tma family protein [Gammaproteobacteria bacterium]|nr:ATP-dependent metallopeptidase FtsH/Yme1/Tma family protein [Gammaproteobacteria bacterium]
MAKPAHHFHFWYFVVALLGVLAIQHLWTEARTVESIPYSEFQRLLKDGQIDEIAIADRTIQGRFKQPQPDHHTRFVTVRVDPGLAAGLEQYGVKFAGVVENDFVSQLLSWVLPALLFFGLWFFLLRGFAESSGLGGSMMAIGKSKAKVYLERDVGVAFDDVAGVDEAKDELLEVVNFLENPRAYGRLGARIPRGVLLVGPPGTGKTLLARAVAGEAGVPFLSINGSEFVEMFVGVGAARVRDLFEQARAKAPAIIFIDELDALGRARGAYGTGGHDEKEQTLNQLLVEMDGFDPSSGLVLLAATNRPEILDPALLRAGRFDRQVLVDRPDRKGRIAILHVHAKRVAIAADVDLEKIAALTPGFSGADLANLVNEAALLATRRGATAVTFEDFTNAMERIVAGLEKKSRILSPRERRVVAYHEMGHALVALALPGSDPVQKVSIIPRGVGALGYTIQRPTEDRFLMTREELAHKMAVLLGGRAAEQLVFDEVSTGAADDLQRVSDIARSMVTRYGMAAALGQVAYEAEPHQFLPGALQMPPGRSFSEATAHAIDEAVKALVETAFRAACDLLATRRAVLERGAEALLAKETLVEAELRELIEPRVP